MQELRFVLIIVGALAIAALLFHGLWTSKKEGKSKFGDKPLGRIAVERHDDTSSSKASLDEVVRKERKEPDFGLSSHEVDPLIADYELDVPATSLPLSDDVDVQPSSVISANPVSEPSETHSSNDVSSVTTAAVAEHESTEEEALQVLVLNVHCAGTEPFIGTKLFDSLQQNGLLYGEMDIYHRHSDLSGTGKVLFSVANMMQPGTLKHDDPALFTTKGISFFMTLPCFGDPEQNFKLMLKTAQQIADDLGANVLDDARNLMTPDRLSAYRKQIQEFKAKQA
ncbi:cell division protein ZipA [Vibrio cincinnatiensis]|jgi:cell division protein ZipA|uniref:Cell division protein ZipA n=1 Tax=Vibrio cincinnatiensis DSM 19608 TaxID=1123491 RepID=A0A1T4PMD4_VIBCI|nr:cell division protein ZipA [Vibrio cincinnatiensis]MCG3736979.1 cell division protein ZipA [Vibrio cincinnatiensis]SJZ92652.1 cell division protein ZipA [Vibrio cincinnatiensis DSM 19608]SUP48950.1 cell division protein ZipA [Vibrio cincinnatiensis]